MADPANAEFWEKQREKSKNEEPAAPSFATWSPERSAMADLIDEMRALRHLYLSAHLKEGNSLKAPEPAPRPRIGPPPPSKREQYEIRRAQHERLADSILARRQQQKAQPESNEGAG